MKRNTLTVRVASVRFLHTSVAVRLVLLCLTCGAESYIATDIRVTDGTFTAWAMNDNAEVAGSVNKKTWTL